MVKSSKKSKEAAAPASLSTGPAPAASTIPNATNSAPPRAKSTARRVGASPAKTSASRKPRAAAAKPRKNRAAQPVVISDDDIRLRAFFISERRIQSGLPGDSAHDWLEAHRQLQEEAGEAPNDGLV